MAMRWDTALLVEEIEALPEVHQVKTLKQGGDVDTTNILVYPKNNGEPCYVIGFDVDTGCVGDPDNWVVEMVELSCGGDSRGGMRSDNEDTQRLFLVLRKFLKARNVDVVDKLDDYF